MNQEEHLSTARELMARADQESQDGGNDVITAEFLWGAFAHCLIVVAQNEGQSHDSHGAFTRIAQHMDAALGGNRWRSYPAQELRSHTRQTTRGTLLAGHISKKSISYSLAMRAYGPGRPYHWLSYDVVKLAQALSPDYPSLEIVHSKPAKRRAMPPATQAATYPG